MQSWAGRGSRRCQCRSKSIEMSMSISTSLKTLERRARPEQAQLGVGHPLEYFTMTTGAVDEGLAVVEVAAVQAVGGDGVGAFGRRERVEEARRTIDVTVDAHRTTTRDAYAEGAAHRRRRPQWPGARGCRRLWRRPPAPATLQAEHPFWLDLLAPTIPYSMTFSQTGKNLRETVTLYRYPPVFAAASVARHQAVTVCYSTSSTMSTHRAPFRLTFVGR